ncbi:hypothetical protein BSLA_02f0186 [Burkholderia stabilis]|nr:hypothetical protein BSLA_02f0186 [Burkholderia stabilis]
MRATVSAREARCLTPSRRLVAVMRCDRRKKQVRRINAA